MLADPEYSQFLVYVECLRFTREASKADKSANNKGSGRLCRKVPADPAPRMLVAVSEVEANNGDFVAESNKNLKGGENYLYLALG